MVTKASPYGVSRHTQEDPADGFTCRYLVRKAHEPVWHDVEQELLSRTHR